MQWSSWVQTCKTEDQQYSDTSHNSECSLTQVTVSVRLAILKWNPLKYFRSKIFGQNGRSINRPLSRSNTFPESVSSNRQNIRVPKIVDIFFSLSLSLSLPFIKMLSRTKERSHWNIRLFQFHFTMTTPMTPTPTMSMMTMVKPKMAATKVLG